MEIEAAVAETDGLIGTFNALLLIAEAEAGVAREALRLAQAEGLQVKLLVPKLLYPVAEPIYQDFFASVQRGLFIEQSHQAQLYRVVRMHVDFPATVKAFAKSGSNPILPTEVLARLRELVVSIQGSQHQPEPLVD